VAIKDILDRLEDAEQDWAGQEFLAPCMPERPVTVRIAGIVCEIKIIDGLRRDFRGWAVLAALSTNRARFVRGAGLAERERYLALFPAVRLILSERLGEEAWLGRPAQAGDRRLQLDGAAAVWLPEPGLQRFDTVVARYDGRLFWYDRRDSARDPALAEYLREQLGREDSRGLPPPPEQLRKRGLSQEERAAYACARTRLEEAHRDRTADRLADAVAHAQGRLHSYYEQDDVYVVTYEVDGQRHTSAIRRTDLTVATAGICLSGQDQLFDLASLVGVLRRGTRQ
jgi:hypothetical protein